MNIIGTSYLFTVPFLQQLSQDLTQPSFKPSNAQQIVLVHALQLLDEELSFQAVDYPDLPVNIDQSVESRVK